MEPALHVHDPAGKLRRESAALSGSDCILHASPESFAEALCAAGGPIVAVSDFTAGPAAGPEVLAGHRPSPRALLLVAVTGVPEGRAWLEAGAADFVVLPGGAPELECRVARLVRLARKGSGLKPDVSSEVALRLSTAAHEIKNPLNVVFGYCHLLLAARELSAEQLADVGHILKNAEEILEIANRLASEALRWRDAVRQRPLT